MGKLYRFGATIAVFAWWATLALGQAPVVPLEAPTSPSLPAVPIVAEELAGKETDVSKRLEAAEKKLKAIEEKEAEKKAKEAEEAVKKAKEDEEKKKADANKFQATWENGFLFTTPNKDFKIHIGGRMQTNTNFFQQPRHLKGPAPGNGGLPASRPGDGVGALDDGFFLRRTRFRADGTAYDKLEFVFELNFEQLNFITYDHMWFGWKDLPYFNTVRYGIHKIPQGMEMIGSDYHLALLERSSLSDAIWTLFGHGLFVANNYWDDRVVAQAMVHRIQPTGFFTSDFGDGDYAATTRLTGLAWYECEGAKLLHLGGSYQWRRADLGRSIQPGGTGSDFGDTQQVVRFRARPELRDATGVSTPPGGNAARFVDTGFLIADNIHTVSPEILLIHEGFSVQAEAAFAFSEGTRSLYPASQLGVNRGTAMFWGGYVETSYILTGEHRGYDKRMGMYDRIKVKNPFRWQRDPSGCGNIFCSGAWQVAYRYSYLDLNDHGITGGKLDQHTFGVNWYFNDNAKIQFQYSLIHRAVPVPANSGYVNGVGVLTQWYF